MGKGPQDERATGRWDRWVADSWRLRCQGTWEGVGQCLQKGRPGLRKGLGHVFHDGEESP